MGRVLGSIADLARGQHVFQTNLTCRFIHRTSIAQQPQPHYIFRCRPKREQGEKKFKIELQTTEQPRFTT